MREDFKAGSTALRKLCWEVRAGRDSDLTVCLSISPSAYCSPTSLSVSILGGQGLVRQGRG